MMSTEMKEQQESAIVVYAKELRDVKHMVYFMTTNQLKRTAKPLHLIHLAHLYELDRLFWKCVESIITTVSVQNFVETVHTFNRYDVVEGLEHIAAFGKEHVDALPEQSV